MVDLLDVDSQTQKFVNDLPLPDVIDAKRPGTYVLQIKQAEQWLGLYSDSDGDGVLTDAERLETTIWGYAQPGQTATYPGPTINAYEGVSIKVQWQNMLPTTGHLLPVDTTIHIADPDRFSIEEGYTPVVTHLHGGHSASSSDGLPEAWFTQHWGERGPDFETRNFTYENDQEGTTLWYHDHTLGITRLNVYAGLAGFYELHDQAETDLVAVGVLPGSNLDYAMAIQDRAFTADGQLYYPAYEDDPLPGTDDTVGDVVPDEFYDRYGEDAPSAVPEFFGDVILVNGMAWPKLDVEATTVRVRLLNGSDSRFYVLDLDDPEQKVDVTLVGTDGGLLPTAVDVTDKSLVLAPGDRLDLVLNFEDAEQGDMFTLRNSGPAFEPFKGDNLEGEPDERVGQIMQFHVVDKPGPAPTPATVTGGTDLLGDAFHDIASPILAAGYRVGQQDSTDLDVRQVALFEGADPETGRTTPMLGVAEDTIDADGHAVQAFTPLAWSAPTTERPTLGETEIWEIYNLTQDAHPIHLHLVQYQVIDKRVFSSSDADEDGLPDVKAGITNPSEATDYLTIGESRGVAPEISGRQDTVWVGPGEVLSLAATFDRPGEYVWHCHILSHEDNEMMRPFEVLPSDKLMIP